MELVRNPLTVLEISAVLCRSSLDFSPASSQKTSQYHHLFWIERGTVFCRMTNGRELTATSVLLLPKGTPYHILCSGPCKIWSIAFDTKEELKSVWMTETAFPTFSKLFSSMEKTFREKESCFQYRLLSSFYLVLETLGQMHFSLDQEIDPIAYDAQRYLREHFAEHGCKVESAAEYCNITRQYLRKIFLRRFQITPMQYLNQLRMDRAKELLIVTTLPLEEVAIQSGFSDHSMFSKVFKEKIGMPPGTYRNTHSI